MSHGTTATSETTSAGARARLTPYLTPGRLSHLEVLERDLEACGQVACVRAGLAAAEAVRERWAWDASRPLLDAALDATRAWLAAPGPATARRAHQASSRLLPLCRAAHERTEARDAAEGDLRSWSVGMAAFGAARAAHARTASSAGVHATGAVAAAMSLLQLERVTGTAPVLPCAEAHDDPAHALLALAIRAALGAG